jgi:hypothetical protein
LYICAGSKNITDWQVIVDAVLANGTAAWSQLTSALLQSNVTLNISLVNVVSQLKSVFNLIGGGGNVTEDQLTPVYTL